MKALHLLFIASIIATNGAFGQTDFTYFLPTKSLKVTVTYTQVTTKRITKSKTAECNKSTECGPSIVLIKDPITVEEVVIPNLKNPVTLALPKLNRAGASFNYSFQWADNGVVSSFNGTREPVTVSLITGAVGLVSTAVSAFTKVVSAGIGAAALTDVEYTEITEEKKFQVIEWIEFSDCDSESGEKEIKIQNLKTPSVKLMYRRIMKANNTKSGSGNITIKSVVPAYYSLNVIVSDNNGMPLQTIISTQIAVPQCGASAEYTFDMMKGKRTVGFQISPSTGMLTKIEYKKESTLKASQEAMQSSITQLSQAIADVQSNQDNKRFKGINEEIENLKKENERLQQLKTKAELEKSLSNQ